MQLTDRQQLLFDRLVTLGEWATQGELPLRVLEIRGFGSFFRGKPRPSDVDLIFRVQRPDHLPEFDQFLALLKSIRCDWDLEEQFSTPHRALERLRSNGDDRCTEASDDDYRKFLNWIEPYSWNMLHPDSMVRKSSFEAPEYYANRMVKRHLPKLNIVAFQNPDDTDVRPADLRCGFTVSIWSTNSTDTIANLHSLLSEKSVVENLHQELAYFNAQIPKAEALTRLYEAEIDLLNRIPQRRKRARSDWKWLEDFTKDHPELKEFQQQLEVAENVADRFDNEQWGRSLKSEKASLVQAAHQADEARKKLKLLYEKNELQEEIRGRLAHFKSGCARTELPAQEYVVDCLLRKGSKKKKEQMAEFLRTLGYPVDRVLQRNEREIIQTRRRVKGRYSQNDQSHLNEDHIGVEDFDS